MTTKYSNIEDDAYNLKHLDILVGRLLKIKIGSVTFSKEYDSFYKVDCKDSILRQILERNFENIRESDTEKLTLNNIEHLPLNKDYYSCVMFLLENYTHLKSKTGKFVIDCTEPKYLYKVLCDYYNIITTDNTFYKASLRYLESKCKNLDLGSYCLRHNLEYYNNKLSSLLTTYEYECFRQHRNLLNWKYRDIDSNNIEAIAKFNIGIKQDYLLRDEIDLMFLLTNYGISKKYKYIENCELTRYGSYLLGKYNYKFYNYGWEIFPELSRYKNIHILVIPKLNFNNPTIEYHIFDKDIFCCVLRMSLKSKVKLMVYNYRPFLKVLEELYIVDDITCQIINEKDLDSRNRLKDYYRRLGSECDYFHYFRRK